MGDLTAIPQPGKHQSYRVLEAFVAGCGGRMDPNSRALPPQLGSVAFYGIRGIEHLLSAAQADGRDWYYGDNAYFDCARGTHFRFAKNAFQQTDTSRIEPQFTRMIKLGVRVQPWRAPGRHIVLVEQSAPYYTSVGQSQSWAELAKAEIVKHTDRPIVHRAWDSNKTKLAATLHEDLRDAWAVVTYSSAAANEALLYGVPVFVSEKSAASPLSSGPLSQIENPQRPEGRGEWAARLAALQWTIDELRIGAAWRALNG